MDVIKKRNNFVETLDITYDNTQRLIKNGIESLKRFNHQDNAQKLRILFAHKIKNYLWTGFFVFGVILVINVVIMTFYLVDSDYNYTLMDNTYVDAVLPAQDIGGVMDMGIVRLEQAKYSSLSVGDQVVVYGDFSLDIYWVETIVSLDDKTRSIELTYDEVSTNTYHIEEIVGQFTSNADFFGTIYYTSTYIRGYIFIALSHVLLMVGYWHAFLNKWNVASANQESTNYREDLGILSGLDRDLLDEEPVDSLKDAETVKFPATVSNIERAIETTKVIEAADVIFTGPITRTKGDIINYITADTGLSNYTGKQFLKYFSQVIIEELSIGNDIHIINFGKFTTVTIPAKDAVNPRNNEKIIVAEHRQARLRFYNEIKSKL